MSATQDVNIVQLLEHEAASTDLVAPTVYRLAETRKRWRKGDRCVQVKLRKGVTGAPQTRLLQFTWDLAEMAMEYDLGHVREDLRKLANAKSDAQITELAAIGTAFCLVSSLMPGERITKVAAIGQRGDFFLNDRRDQMLEISGTLTDDLDARFARKKRQILLNETLRKAVVNVSRFASATSRLERVK